MKHLSEEELVGHCYEPERAAVQSHIETCSDCQARYAALQHDLAALEPAQTPELGPDYGEHVWSRLEPLLSSCPAASVPRGNLLLWRGLSYAAACAVLVAAAFFAGRAWEHKQPPAAAVKAPPPPRQHLVVVVLGDHLDRSERLLVQLKHADANNADLVAPLRDQARSLLAENRTFRQDADKSGDPALATALNHLEDLLNHLANEPGGINAAAISRLQKEMNADGLLFEVRVLRARVPHRQPPAHIPSNGGTI